jgi:hypothetical protein
MSKEVTVARERKLPRPDDADASVDFPEEEDMDESAEPNVAPPDNPDEIPPTPAPPDTSEPGDPTDPGPVTDPPTPTPGQDEPEEEES